MFFKLKIHILRILTLQNQGYQCDNTYRLAFFLRHLSTFYLVFLLFTCRFSIFYLFLHLSNRQKRSVIRHSMTIKKSGTLPDFSIGGAKLTEGASLIVYMYVLVFIYQYISYSQSVSSIVIVTLGLPQNRSLDCYRDARIIHQSYSHCVTPHEFHR